MFNLIVARRNCIKIHSFLSCFIHQKSLEKEKPLNEKDSSLTLSYLFNTCGLSHQAAISASKKINSKTPHITGIVIETLKSYDFTDAQITALLTKCPILSLPNAEKILKPKLDYYLGLGYSPADLKIFITKYPVVLYPSLEKRIKPNVELLRSIFKNNLQIINVVNSCCWLLMNNISSTLVPNIKTLESYGVGHANIFKLISLFPWKLMLDSEKFAKVVQSAKEFGFNPLSFMFVKAISVLSGVSSLSWGKKVEVFKSLGLTQKDVETAFVKHPQCMALSEYEIKRRFEYFAKEMKWDPSFVAARPLLLLFSLEKRVIPRCLVMRVLASKGFVKDYPSLHYQFLLISERKFLENYVTNYKERVPEVLDVYKVKLK